MARPAFDPRRAYLAEQVKFDAQLRVILRDAASQAVREINRLRLLDGIGARVREAQLRFALSAIKTEQAFMWRKIGNLIESKRAEVAAVAAEQGALLDISLFREVPGGQRYVSQFRDQRFASRAGLEALRARASGDSAFTLSERVYRNAALASGRIDRIVNSALARGASAREIANEVRGLILPSTPGGVSYSAMRLGRTELNNAFHAVSSQLNDEKPWVNGTKWNLSRSHPAPDKCDQYAKHNGDGVWQTTSVPSKPHPQCLCFVTPVVVDREEFASSFAAGRYDSYLQSINPAA